MSQAPTFGNIAWAQECARPSWLRGKPRAQGVQALGLRYERAAAHELRGTTHGQWFTYGPGLTGKHWCQPDLLYRLAGETIVFECKLTDVEQAQVQLHELYLPVVMRAYKVPALGIVLTKHLSKVTDRALVVTTLADALKLARAGLIPTLHWLGNTALVTRLGKSKAEILASPASLVQ